MTPLLSRLAVLGSLALSISMLEPAWAAGDPALNFADTRHCTTNGTRCLDSVFVIELLDKKGKFSSLCTGVAINPHVILTAAHCIEATRDEKGSWLIYEGATYEASEAPLREVARAGIHPLYDPDEAFYEYDIGFLVVNRALSSRLHYPQIPRELPTLQRRTQLLRVGYGARNHHNRLAKAWPRFDRYLKHQGAPYVMKLKDDESYGGDSGGPLFWDSPQGMVLLAVHSTVESDEEEAKAVDRIYAPLLTPVLDWLEGEEVL